MPPPSSTNSLPPGPPPSAPDDYADAGARAIDLSDRPIADSLREIMASSPRWSPDQPPPLPPAQPSFKNRHWTLAMGGLLVLWFAFAVAGASVWSLVSLNIDGVAPEPQQQARLLIKNPVWVAAGLSIGLGLILARRWARHFLVAGLVGWMVWSLVSGLAIIAHTLPDFSSLISIYDPTPAWWHLVRLLATAAVSWFMWAVLSHRNVRLTCEQAQPATDWSDRLSGPDRLLQVVLVWMATTWAGLASYHPWPAWGHWEFESAVWVWGGAALTAVLATRLIAQGRRFGVWLALALVMLHGSAIVTTALRQPVDEFSQVWDGWCFNQRGGLTYSILSFLIVFGIAIAAMRSRHRRATAAPSPPE